MRSKEGMMFSLLGCGKEIVWWVEAGLSVRMQKVPHALFASQRQKRKPLGATINENGLLISHHRAEKNPSIVQ